MPQYRYEAGMHFRYQSQEYVVEQKLPKGEIQIRELATDSLTVKTMSALVDDLYDGKIELLGDDQNYAFLKQKLAKSHASDFTQIDDDDPRKIEAYRRIEYINEIGKRKIDRLTPKSLKPIIDSVHERLKDSRKHRGVLSIVGIRTGWLPEEILGFLPLPSSPVETRS